GANVIADSGGGSGKAVTVKTAISADITADCTIVVTRLLLDEEPPPVDDARKIQFPKKRHTRSGNMLEKSRMADGLSESNCNLILFPSAGIIRIRLTGRRRVSRPLSRVSPSSPCTFNHQLELKQNLGLTHRANAREASLKLTFPPFKPFHELIFSFLISLDNCHYFRNPGSLYDSGNAEAKISRLLSKLGLYGFNTKPRDVAELYRIVRGSVDGFTFFWNFVEAAVVALGHTWDEGNLKFSSLLKDRSFLAGVLAAHILIMTYVII